MGALDNLKNNTSGGGTSGAGYTTGTVYLGPLKTPVTVTKRRGPSVVTETISDKTISITEAKKLYVTDPKVRAQWDAAVKAAGFESNDPIKSRMLWDMAVDGAADWYQTSNGVQKVTPQQYLQWYSKTTGQGQKKDNLPSRQVYMYDPATINNLIEKTLSDTLDRKPTPSEQKEFYTAIKKMIDQGTVTTTKVRINPKTGKEESYSVTTPGFTQEKAQSFIEEKLKAENPQDYQEKKSLDFADFLFGMRG